MPYTIQVSTNSHRPAFCWKWTQRSVLLLLRLLLLLLLPRAPTTTTTTTTSLLLLNRVKNTLDQKSGMLLINALIFSHLNDYSSILGKCNEKLMYEVQKCINFAAKVANNWKYLKYVFFNLITTFM